MSDAKASRPQGAQPPMELSPYQLSLAAMTFPWPGHWAFNILAGASLALVGAPALAAAWTVALCLADVAMQAVLGRWAKVAGAVEPHRGLTRLSWLVWAKTALWFSAPIAFVLSARSAAGLAYVAVTAISMTALGVSLGWTSRRIFAAMVTPAVLAVLIAVLAVVGVSAASAGVLLGVLTLAATLALITLGTHRAVSDWAKANSRTVEAMSDLRVALERSEAAERRLGMAIQIADLHVFEVDYTRRSLVSLGAERDFFEQPLTYEKVVDNPFGDVTDEFRPKAEAAWADYLAGKAPYRVEYRVQRQDGREVWAFAAAELIRDEAGKPLSLVGALHNVTERKRSELALTAALDRAEAGSRAKSEFLATMSHEIRTPLNGVLGMAQAMSQDKLAASQRVRLEVIRKSGESLLTLLNSVLDLSKIEAGKFALDEGEVDIEAIARAAADAFSAEAQAKGVQIGVLVGEAAKGVYAGDAVRLSQVLYNLVSNAVKFTPEGSVTLAVDRRGRNLVVQVADTGVGISADQQAGLFEKFVQADSSVTRRFGGTGLGLAICRQLVTMMGGTIELESRENAGSTFTLKLPLKRLRGEGSKPARTAIAPLAVAEDAPPLRVLAAEDNEVNQLVLQTLLQQVGIEPTIVSDGAEALAAWHTQDWDIILMDVQMPVLDGVSAARTIRAEEAESGRARTPIVALTANVMAHQILSYRAVGIDDVVGKPLQIGRLLDVIAACVAQRRAAAAA
ncbi:MAG: ATP-binding protein [Phenylobacterium sp.]